MRVVVVSDEGLDSVLAFGVGDFSFAGVAVVVVVVVGESLAAGLLDSGFLALAVPADAK